MEIFKKLIYHKEHYIEVILCIVILVLGIIFHNEHRKQTFAKDAEKTMKAAEAGNMKVVREMLKLYPEREEFVQFRHQCFERIRDDYKPLNPDCDDKQYNSFMNRRIRTEGVCVKDVEKMKDGKLWACIQIPSVQGEGRYIQLFFEKKEYSLEGLKSEGLVQGERVRAYGFLDRIDKKLLRRDDLGIRPVEMIEVIRR